MRSSTVFNLACAGLAVAGPLAKKALVTEIETETVIVYVTAGDVPAVAAPTAVASTTSSTPEFHAAQVTQVSNNEHLVVGVVNQSRTSAKSATSQSSTSTSTLTTPPPPTVQSTSSSSSTANIPSSTKAVTSTTPVVVVTPTSSQAAASTSAASGDVAVGGTTSGSTATSGCSGLVTPTDYQSTALYWHNIHRCNHSAPAVTWDTGLASSAATLAATCNFHHDITIGGGGYGQNIASYGSSGDVASLSPSNEVASAASEMWYNGELPLFSPSFYGEANPDFTNFEEWGHFTQLVWKATTKIGCASQYCSAGTLFPTLGGWFTVCNYNPAGNMGGAYGTNVLKPLGHATIHS